MQLSPSQFKRKSVDILTAYHSIVNTSSVAISQLDEVLGTADSEGLIHLANTCYAQVTVRQHPVYKLVYI